VPQPKVLIVEDDLLVLHLSSQILRQDGLDVVEAASADEAADILREDGHGIAVVFTDIRTPGTLDGMDLAHVVREGWPSIPVVLTSGVVMPIAVALPDKTRFVPKPYDMSKVSKLITNLAGTWGCKARNLRGADASPPRAEWQ